MLQAMLACAARQRQPDPVAFASFMNWILVRNCITVLHRSMPTIDVFQEMLEDCSFTSEQHKFTKALKTIYTKGCQKIYSPFAYEDCAVQVFHSNLRHCSECSDPFAFWFLLLAFAAGTNRHMMSVCQQFFLPAGSFVEMWNSDGRGIFQNANAEVYKSCTRRGNLTAAEMRSVFVAAIDSLCECSTSFLKNKWASAMGGHSRIDACLLDMTHKVGLKSIGEFKVYFVSKMLHVFDARFRFRTRAGPSVSLAAKNSALRLLFPAVPQTESLDIDLLQVCMSKSAEHLPKDVVTRLQVDDVEHSACEWMRTLRYGKLLPLREDEVPAELHPMRFMQGSAMTVEPKRMGFPVKEKTFACSDDSDKHGRRVEDQDTQVDDALKALHSVQDTASSSEDEKDRSRQGGNQFDQQEKKEAVTSMTIDAGEHKEL